MGRCRNIGIHAVVATALALFTATPAPCWEGVAAWTRADVGLQHERSGLALGVAGRNALGAGPLDLVYGIEYVQKSGAQPALFADPTAGFVFADAEVVLHCLQPLLALEWRIGTGALPRPYVGAGFAIKVSEAWSAFPGDPNEAYGFRDVDAALLLGVCQRVGPVDLDLRYGLGLTEQLLIDETDRGGVTAAKAGDPVPGAVLPEIDARVSWLQVGVRLPF